MSEVKLKYTDTEIIDTLVYCTSNRDCMGCPRSMDTFCRRGLRDDVLALLRRKEAKIKELEAGALENAMKFNSATVGECVSEAVRSFAEKLQAEIRDAIRNNKEIIIERVTKHGVEEFEDPFCRMCYGKILALDGVSGFIDNLVEEMTEGEAQGKYEGVQWNKPGPCPVTPEQFEAIYNDEEEEMTEGGDERGA